MINIIWGTMIVVGFVYGIITGNMERISTALVDSSKEAVNLCITMVGVMSFWCGIIEVAKKCGLIGKMLHMIEPFINWMFPRLKNESLAREYIGINIISNICGMGWAATPAGLNAMRELSRINSKCKEREHIASDEMCTFLVINISSLQLIPVNLIAYRSQYGAVNPASVVGPGIVATLVSTIVAIIFCKLMCNHS